MYKYPNVLDHGYQDPDATTATLSKEEDTIISGGEESLRGMNNVLRDPALRKKFDECD